MFIHLPKKNMYINFDNVADVQFINQGNKLQARINFVGYENKFISVIDLEDAEYLRDMLNFECLNNPIILKE